MTVPEGAKLLGAGADEGDATVQDLKVVLAQHKFNIQRQDISDSDRKAIVSEVEKILQEHSMSGVYEHFCSHFGWQSDQGALAKMKEANEARVKELDEKIAEAEKNEGDEEVRDAMLERADYFCNVGDKERAWEAYEAVQKKSPSANHKMTIAFCKIRLELLLGNWSEIKQLLDAAKEVCEKGGDWEKKNRLMVYEGVYCLAQRQFERAAKLFLDSVATFTTYELFDYERCIFYAVVASIITLPRPDLKKKVVEASEVLTVLHKLPAAQKMLHALYYCDYQHFFPGFLETVSQLERDAFLAPHVRFYMREARVVVYQQYLASYKSVTLAAMAGAFGVSPAFMDSEVSEFIVAGRLAAKIDKVANTIETVGAQERHSSYHKLIKEGDLLLNRIQKLSKIVDVE